MKRVDSTLPFNPYSIPQAANLAGNTTASYNNTGDGVIQDIIEISAQEDDFVTNQRLKTLLLKQNESADVFVHASRLMTGILGSDKDCALPPREVIYLLTKKNFPLQVRQNLCDALLISAIRAGDSFTKNDIDNIKILISDCDATFSRKCLEVYYILPHNNNQNDFLKGSVQILRDMLTTLTSQSYKTDRLYSANHEKIEEHKYKNLLLKRITENYRDNAKWQEKSQEILSLLKELAKQPLISLQAISSWWDITNLRIKNAANDRHLLLELIRQTFSEARNIPVAFVEQVTSVLPVENENNDSEILRDILSGVKGNTIKEVSKLACEKLGQIANDNQNATSVKLLAVAILERLGIELRPQPLPTSKPDSKPLIDTSAFNIDSLLRDELKAELLAKNHRNKAITYFVDDIDNRLSDIMLFHGSDSKIAPQGMSISKFTPQQLANWSKMARSQVLSLHNKEHVSEVMAVIVQATRLDRSYSPREVQVIAVLHLLDAGRLENGRLLQINTGEGKSLITAMLAAAKVLLEGKKIDIITSSSVLARRDASEVGGQKNFFNLLDISCSHNCIKKPKGFKECYNSDVVYGDTLSFQADYLRAVFKGDDVRGTRKFEAVIVDEVDSMLIDESSKIAKLAMPICGMEHLETMFIFIYRQIEGMELNGENFENEGFLKELQEHLTDLINRSILPSRELVGSEQRFKIIVPKFLHEFVIGQSMNWAHSALRAQSMRENIDYVIANDEDGDQIIAPVDYDSTGIIQKNTSWSNGLHQFLQVKHRLRITPETLTTSFISNMSYFKLYGNDINGMSGTLGSEGEKNLLQEIYGLDSAIIPTFKPKVFDRWEDIISSGNEDHIARITASSIEQANKGRAVLVICETIASGKDIAESIKRQNHQGRVKQYLHGDENEGGSELKCKGGDIIVATNLAGRGTDIETTPEIETKGGLHVIIGFIPNNLRVEEQAFGRTSRKGNNGSGQMIINELDVINKFQKYGIDIKSQSESLKANPKLYRSYRDEIEQIRLERSKNGKAKSLEFEDSLFHRFNAEIYQPLKKRENNAQKLLQLEDLWGFWLVGQQLNPEKISCEQTRAKIEENFGKLKQDLLDRYGSISIMENPAYMTNYVLNKLGVDSSYGEPIDLLDKPERFDPSYSYQMHNLKAYSHLRHNATLKDTGDGPKWQQDNIIKAAEHLHIASEQIENVVMPQLQSSLLLLGPESNNSPLYKQLDNKIRLLDTALQNLKENEKFIRNNIGQKVTVKIANHSLQSYESLFKDRISYKDINELANFGMSFLYRADSQPYSRDHLTGSVVALAGIAQVVVGALVAIGSAGFAAEFGISLAVGGVGDIINGVNSALKGEAINLSNWLEGKGIELAVSLAMAGISSAVSKGGKVANVAAEGTKITTKTLSPAMFGVALGKRIATSYIVEYATGKMKNAAARPIKAEVKRLEAAISQSLKAPEVNRQMQEICMIDSLNRPGGHKQQFQKQVLSVIDRKSNQFAGIAQNLLTHTMSKAVSSSTASAAITVASTAYSVAKGADDIDELKDYLLSGISSSANSVRKELPDVERLLEYSCRGMSKQESAEITTTLQQNGILTGKYQVNLSKLGFVSGIDQISSTSSDAKTQHNTQTTASQKFEYQDLTGQAVMEEQIVLQAPVNSSSNQRQLQILGGNKWRLQTTELLSDLERAGSKNYDSEIDAIAANISGVVSDRTRGLIRSGIISPLTGAIVSASLEFVLDKTGLEKAITEQLESQLKPVGVAAGGEELEWLSRWQEDKLIEEHVPQASEHSQEDITKLLEIEKKLLEEYPGLPPDADIRALAFEILERQQRWTLHPDERPPLLLADSGMITFDVPLYVTRPSVEQEAMRSVMNNYSSGVLQIPSIWGAEQNSNSKQVKDDELDNKAIHSRTLFNSRGNPAIDKFIGNVISVFGEQYQESLQESNRQKGISSLDLFKSRNQEINQNVLNIRQGRGHLVFKSSAEFNEIFGGSLRYLFDQVSHTAHVIAPGSKALFDASLGTVGRGVRELYLELPIKYRMGIENTYKDVMGHFPTKNQKFAVELPTGMLLGQLTTSGLKLAVVGKTLPAPVLSPKPIITKSSNVVRAGYGLPKTIAETFVGYDYTTRVLKKDTILYRAGSDKYTMGQFFSKDKPKSVKQVRIDKALPPLWSNGEKSIVDTVYTFKVPAGTVVHSGKISTQGGHFVGGTQQIVIEKMFGKGLKLIKKEPLK